MTNPQPLEGVYLPLVTPFSSYEVDYSSLTRMLLHYGHSGISGLVMLGTTGESPVLSGDEVSNIILHSSEVLGGRLPMYLGISGNDTRAVATQIKAAQQLPVDGYLVTCPYYNRPSQKGLIAHYEAVIEETERDIIVYNIPYRTGVNLSNDSLFELVESHAQVVAVKDSCGDIKQSLDLLNRGKDRLRILTGEDHLFYLSVALGGAGAILAVAHVQPERFVSVYDDLRAGRAGEALATWDELSAWIPLMFEEPNPAPLKVWLAAQGLIDSAECRLPLAAVPDPLAAEIRRRLPAIAVRS